MNRCEGGDAFDARASDHAANPPAQRSPTLYIFMRLAWISIHQPKTLAAISGNAMV